MHLLTDRYTLGGVEAVRQAEVIIGPDGEVTASGVTTPLLADEWHPEALPPSDRD